MEVETRDILVSILAAMSQIIDEDSSVRLENGHINMIAVFSRFTQGDLGLLALHFGIPGDISTEYLPDRGRGERE